MKKSKAQKGITLIALIITIVVLLILAVVAIKVVQEDGIIAYAKDAAKETSIAYVKEVATMTFNEEYNLKQTEDMAAIREKVITTLEENGVKTENYNIYVSERGVDVSVKEIVNIPIETTGKGNIVVTTAGNGKYNVTSSSEEGNILEAGSFILVENNEEKRIFLDDATSAVIEISDIENATIKAVFVGKYDASIELLEPTIRQAVAATETTSAVNPGIRFGFRTNNIKIVNSSIESDEKIYINGEECTLEAIGYLTIPTSIKGDVELTVDTNNVSNKTISSVAKVTENYSDVKMVQALPTSYLNVPISFRGYIKYTDSTGTTQYFYSDEISKSYNELLNQ